VASPKDHPSTALRTGLGSVKVIVNTSGNRVAHTDLYPFGFEMPGRVQCQSGPDCRYKFTGKERDSETQYDYFGARYYDARIGRWLSIDPLAHKAPDITPYHYCHNDPLCRIDPDGSFDPPQITIFKVGVKKGGLPTNTKEAKVWLREGSYHSADQLETISTEVETYALAGAALTAWTPVSPFLLTTSVVADATGTVASGVKFAISGSEKDAVNFVANVLDTATGTLIKKSVSVSQKLNTTAKKDFTRALAESFVNLVKKTFVSDVPEKNKKNEEKKNE